MDNAVALAALGLAATTVGALIWFIKWVSSEFSEDIKAHTAAAVSSTEASMELKRSVDKLYELGSEQHDFMKNLNGKLTKAVVDTAKES